MNISQTSISISIINISQQNCIAVLTVSETATGTHPAHPKLVNPAQINKQ